MEHDATARKVVRPLTTLVALVFCALSSAQGLPTGLSRLDQEVTSLYQQGQYARATVSAKQALRLSEDAFGPAHPDVALRLYMLAGLYSAQDRYSEAEPLLKRSLAIIENALGVDHKYVANNLNNLADLYEKQGRYTQAEPFLKRSLSIMEKAHGPDHHNVATILNNLGENYMRQGQYLQASTPIKRALQIRERTLGLDHPDVAFTLDSLARLYVHQAQNSLAAPLFKRALTIRESALGPDHPDVASSLGNLSECLRAQGESIQAEPLAKRALAIREKTLGPDHSNVASSLNNLAGVYDTLGQYVQAEPLYKRALAIREKTLGPEHPQVAESLNNLAGVYASQGWYARAEPLHKRTLAIQEKALGGDHPDVARSLHNFAANYALQSQWAKALVLERRASAITRRRVVSNGLGDAAISEAATNREGFLSHLALLSLNPMDEPRDTIAAEAFQIVQLVQATGTASAIAKMAARFTEGSDAMARLIRRAQDTADQLHKQEAQLVALASRAPQQRDAASEQRLREDIALAIKEGVTIDAELSRRFPKYQALTRPEPVTISQVQALLKPGEAMLVYAFTTNGYVWVVKSDGAKFLPLRLDVKDITTLVSAARAEMDFDSKGAPLRVGVRSLYDLHQKVFAPVTPHLTGINHVMVVPAGPLQGLPFGMLVANPPPIIRSDADYREVDWLAKRYAFSVLPSVSSIQALRLFAKRGRAPEPFAGFGDPAIGEHSGTTRGKRTSVDVARVFGSLLKATNNRTLMVQQNPEIADVESIRGTQGLPETADELRAMAKALKSGGESIWLRENATETNVKRFDLTKYRTIAFATHGVMAGEFSGVGEPGLILTPPKQGSAEDDGYLSASEIAKLRLNADWIILSACNTASADGTPGAEGLSGLAKAFFYAGARSLLVSHWSVDSEATVPLTTGMLKEYETNPASGRAEAQRKAMLALMNTTDHPEYAHPVFWAPFVVVGEGGSAGN